VQPSLIGGDGRVSTVRWSEIFLEWRGQTSIVIGRFRNAERLMPGEVKVGKLRIADVIKVRRVGENQINSAVRNPS
jgi:hypothetical protein